MNQKEGRRGGKATAQSSDCALIGSSSAARQAPLLAFISCPSLKTFKDAFPHLAGRDLSFSDWLELNNDSLPEPQSFSEWIATIYDAISPEGKEVRRNEQEI